ncbi:ATPase WRNIP1-like [Ostrinia nubilalis]|uniref:ATPase WRNIP1-like n=1 Tax=Ostrinia nubilalis TaxID=29057 RepID=UPI00308262AE
MSHSTKTNSISCPVCSREFQQELIEEHVNKCLFLNTPEQSGCKRDSPFHKKNSSHIEKRIKLDSCTSQQQQKDTPTIAAANKLQKSVETKSVPLAETLRPVSLNDIVGHKEAFGPGTMLYSMLEQRKVPNMILWGPPGCGKTSLANVVSHMCKESKNMRFVKLSATMAGINDVKEIVKVAKNEAQFKRQTILFMDEIHRFNKLQQDTFLPHVENGTITLIGATTENPSFSLNNALLSRCRVIVMQKLSVDDVLLILKKAIQINKEIIIAEKDISKGNHSEDAIPRVIITQESLQWLAEVCDGDARIALGALELTIASRNTQQDVCKEGPAVISLEDIQQGIKRTHMLYDRKGEEHYNIISALHKSIRASDDNAALYWITRALSGGEDPLYIARRLIRMACEDIGLADPNALVEAVACLQGCQNIGMPECDVLLVQCAVRLARAEKSREVYCAMKQCQRFIQETKGPLPPVPLHLRNAPTKLMKQLGYGDGYNLLEKDKSGLTYMPSGLEDINFFKNNT